MTKKTKEIILEALNFTYHFHNDSQVREEAKAVWAEVQSLPTHDPEWKTPADWPEHPHMSSHSFQSGQDEPKEMALSLASS